MWVGCVVWGVWCVVCGVWCGVWGVGCGVWSVECRKYLVLALLDLLEALQLHLQLHHLRFVYRYFRTVAFESIFSEAKNSPWNERVK